MRIISLVILTTVAVLNVYMQDRENISIIKYRKITKALLIPSLLAFFLMENSDIDKLIVSALVFAWIGDIFLMADKVIQKSDKLVEEIDDKYVILGMLSFMIGHLFYSASFITKISDFAKIPFEIYSLIIIFILFATFMLNVVRPTGVMKIGVLIYSMVLALMGYSTLLLMYDNFSLSTVMMFVGALVFISSDSVLSLSLIKKMKGVPKSYVMKSYISAQFIIILGLLMY